MIQGKNQCFESFRATLLSVLRGFWNIVQAENTQEIWSRDVVVAIWGFTDDYAWAIDIPLPVIAAYQHAAYETKAVKFGLLSHLLWE